MLLPIIEMVINSLPNQSTGFSPFFLNYVHEPVMPIQLLRGNEQISAKSVASFVRRVTSDWELVYKDQWVCNRNTMTVNIGIYVAN